MPKNAKLGSSYSKQPAVAAILKLLDRPKGATVAEIATARELQPHSVRAVVSRLGSRAEVRIERTKVAGRGLVYRVVKRP